MFRKYTINGWAESREYFLSILGRDKTESNNAKLLNGEKLEIDGNVFQIFNVKGI